MHDYIAVYKCIKKCIDNNFTVTKHVQTILQCKYSYYLIVIK